MDSDPAALPGPSTQLGAGEEIDALRTMGFDPVRWLVVPRCIALVVAVPLLTWIGDAMAILGGDDSKIRAALVKDNVGDWRIRTAWELIDAAADGEANRALEYLDRLLRAGEQPIALLAQMSSTFRRFAVATRIFQRRERAGDRPSLQSVVAEAGFPPFKLRDAQRQLQKIGRQRASQLHRWLLAADLALKGRHSAEPRARIVLEELIVKLSREADPRRSAD